MHSGDQGRFGFGPSLFLLLLCLFWGGIAPAVKLALVGMGPYSIAGWRFLVGLVVILIWSLGTGGPLRQPTKQRLGLFLFSLVFVMQIAAVNTGIRLTLSSYAVVLLNTSPIFVAVLAHWWIPGERMNTRKAVGLATAFAGVFAMFMPAAPSGELLAGNLLALAGGFLLAIIHVFSKHLVQDIKPGQLVFWEFAYAVPLFFLLSYLFEPEPYLVSAQVVGSILYQGIIVAGFCFVAWMHLLLHRPASKMVSFQFSIPVFGVFLSWILLDEPLSKHLLVCAGLVATGIFLVTSSQGKTSGNLPTDTI